MIDYNMRADEALARMKKQLAAVEWDKVDRDRTVRQAWKDELATVRKQVQQAARAAVPNDRAGVWKGVSVVTYKRISGGNVNILKKTKGGVTMNMSIYNREHKRYTSKRTRMMESYWGASRSFILRFVNEGTRMRTAGSNGNNRGGRGNRGALTARRWFMPAAWPAAERAAARLREIYVSVMNKEFYKA